MRERNPEREREAATEGVMEAGRVGRSFRKKQQKAAGDCGLFSQG